MGAERAMLSGSSRPAIGSPALPLALLALLAGCPSEPPGAGPAHAAAARRVVRSEDPRAVAAREALEDGQLERARDLLQQAEQVEGLLGVEARLLRARLAFLEEDLAVWGRLLEEARLEAPEDPRVYAAASELYAAAGKMETAELEIQRGLKRCGVTPELERARGVNSLYVPGAARAALRFLESAREHDPELPFCDRALGQGHLLVAKSWLASDPDPERALGHVRRSLEFDPEDLGAREFHGDLLMMIGEWGDGMRVFEDLLRDGHDKYRMQLADYYHKAGILSMKQRERARALDYCARARELGMAEEHLSSCANLLADESRRRVASAQEAARAGDLELADSLAREALEFTPDFAPAGRELAAHEVSRGVGDLGRDDLDGAVEHFSAALELDSESLEAHNFLAQAYYARGEYSRAASQWEWVIDTARLERLELPEPVHVKLAEAKARAGDFSGARQALDAYLLFEPTGAYVELTREVLGKLPD